MNPAFKKIALRLFLISVPALIWVAWQLSLPKNQYTFRGWESLITGSSRWRTGFFPNQTLQMNEVGDLAPYTVNAVPHPVFWKTDALGYRNDESVCADPEVVVIGDSMAMGASLSQEDTLSAQLTRDSHHCVRSFAGGKLYSAMNQVYQSQLHPRWVILVLVERNTHVIDELKRFGFEKRLSWLDPVPFSVAVPWSHFMKKFYWNYRSAHGVFAAVQRSVVSPEDATSLIAPRVKISNPPEPELLFFGQAYNSDDGAEQIEPLKHTLTQFAAQLQTQGARLMVTFVPNKESVYYEQQGRPEPGLGKRLAEILPSDRYEYLDLIHLFQDEYQKNHELLHQSDDTHWNRKGVEVLSHAIAQRI
jgi:hypothetical protein